VQTRTVLISGASVAGPALAFWLHRYGFDPVVVERAPRPRGGGYAVDVRGAAITAVERMGLLPDVRRAHTGTARARFVDGTGRTVAALDAGAIGGDTDGADAELLRGHLARILIDATRSTCEYVYGDSITALEEGPAGVRVSFENGPDRVVDLVVGADGLHSNVRALAFGPEERYLRHLGRYIAICTVPNHLGLDREAVLCTTPGRVAGLYSGAPHTARAEPPRAGEPPLTGPNPEAKALLAFARRDGGATRPADRADRVRVLEEVFGGMGWEVPAVLAGVRADPDLYFDGITQIRMPGWTRGRTALVGDAAYGPSPMSGQGTSMALVGAYVLAGELAAAGGDPAVALPRYEAETRAFMRANQDIAAPGARFLVPATAAGLRVRDLAVRSAPLLARLGAPGSRVGRAARSITLRDYRDHAVR
jgi:2-polyprenyl-6-methoxyphenol hydroxylase-like FAD-dependent oxidoreductase